MSLTITAQDKAALERLAELCPGGLTEDSIKQCCSQLTDDKIRRCVLTIVYHPLYDNARQGERLRCVANPNDARSASRSKEQGLGKLFFERMWAFKRVGAEKEMFIQYALPPLWESDYLDPVFKLEMLWRRPEDKPPYGDGQYSFWTPDISSPRLFCCGLRENLARSQGGYDSWTRLKSDGRYGPSETNHPARGRTFCCSELTTTGEQPPIKDYVPCSLREISAFLRRCSECFYQVTFPVDNIRTEDCQTCQLYQHESEYLLLDRSSQYSEDSYCRYQRVLFFKNGVWIERRVESLSTRTWATEFHLAGGTSITQHWYSTPEDQYGVNTQWMVHNGNNFKIIKFPTETSIELGMEFQTPVDGYGLNQLALRTISPTMVLPTEAEQIIGFARQFLEDRGFSAPLFRLLLAYWYPQAFTLPEVW